MNRIAIEIKIAQKSAAPKGAALFIVWQLLFRQRNSGDFDVGIVGQRQTFHGFVGVEREAVRIHRERTRVVRAIHHNTALRFDGAAFAGEFLRRIPIAQVLRESLLGAVAVSDHEFLPALSAFGRGAQQPQRSIFAGRKRNDVARGRYDVVNAGRANRVKRTFLESTDVPTSLLENAAPPPSKPVSAPNVAPSLTTPSVL